MKRQKLYGLLILTALFLSLFSLPARAEAAAYHEETSYLTDTLTLAGSGFEEVRTLTVGALEAMAAADGSALFYENDYSTLTSGSVYARHRFSGLLLYPLLLQEGLDPDLPDMTKVQLIAKDGYCIYMDLGDLRSDKYCRFSSLGGSQEEKGLPVIIAFASDGKALVGPTGSQSVYRVFTVADGYDEKADNIGGPLRLITGQTSSYEFNAPNCAKWLAAIVVGDPQGYVYQRTSDADLDFSEPDQSGDWTHKGAQSGFRLTVSGTEAKKVAHYSLAQLEEGPAIRQYFAASGGRFAFEGLALKDLINENLAPGLNAPSKITIKAADGFSKTIDVNTALQGIDSFYQPGRHREVLLAWAVDGSPLVLDKNSPGYDGTNAFGPLRLVVENTISLWVKSVCEIVLGDDSYCPYQDVTTRDWYYNETAEMFDTGLMQGWDDRFYPDEITSRAMIVSILYRLAGSPEVSGSPEFVDVAAGSWYAAPIAWARENGVAQGAAGAFRPNDPVSRQELAVLLYRAAGSPEVTGSGLQGFSDSKSAAAWAVPALNWAVNKGILNGAGGRIDAGGPATRCQTAAMFNRYLDIQD